MKIPCNAEIFAFWDKRDRRFVLSLKNSIFVAIYENVNVMGLPELFIEQIHRLLPANDADALITAIGETEPSVSVRINAHKQANVPDTAERVPWCERGFYLPERPTFTFDPAFHSGSYYVQDASSMFLSHVIERFVDKSSPVRYLDLCAAPGGKTTTAIDALPEGSLVVANEIMSNRAQILRENIIKWGHSGCVVTCNDSAAFTSLTHFFDVVAADVPCSGEGMMRKDDEAVAQWTPALVKECATRQFEIVSNAWETLRPGGLFIYSTCTFNRHENEDVVEYMVNELGAESLVLDLPKEWNIHPAIGSQIHGCHFFPHRTRGEGLFMAVLRKPDDEPRTQIKVSGKKKGKKEKVSQVPSVVKEWLADTKNMKFSVQGDSVYAVPESRAEETALLQDCLRVIHCGVEVATMKGHDLIPSHALAMCTKLNAAAFPSCDVDYATAIAYLRGETIVIDAPRGYVLVKYAGQALGFVKNLGNRANNLYPKEWRVKSTHIPPTPPQIIV